MDVSDRSVWGNLYTIKVIAQACTVKNFMLVAASVKISQEKSPNLARFSFID
jgi:hypothetical protein